MVLKGRLCLAVGGSWGAFPVVFRLSYLGFSALVCFFGGRVFKSSWGSIVGQAVLVISFPQRVDLLKAVFFFFLRHLGQFCTN